MTKTTLLVSLGELETVRVTCNKKDPKTQEVCGTAIEFKLLEFMGSPLFKACPGCDQPLGYDPGSSPKDALGTLSKAISALKALATEKGLAIEFPIDAPKA